MRRKRQKFTIPSKYLLLIMTCVCVLFMAVTFLRISGVSAQQLCGWCDPALSIGDQ